MSAISTEKVLIPAAGYGKRCGAPPAKELLIDPETGRPLIESALALAERAGATPVVITRRSKVALIDYLARRPGAVELCLIEFSDEWPDTLLQSQPYWGAHQIVVLPDTRFAPLDIHQSLFGALREGCGVVFATFGVIDRSVWGMVGERDGSMWVAEKPVSAGGFQKELAWGLFGFDRQSGPHILGDMLESGRDHEWKRIERSARRVELESFRDLTRTVAALDPAPS